MNGCFNCKYQNTNICNHCRTDIGEWWEHQVKTNADRIRAMTDEELAEFIYQNGYGSCPNIPVCPQYASGKMPYTGDGCKKCWLDWLKQEAT